MWRLLERRKAEAISFAIRVAVIALFGVVLPATSSLAQAGLMVGVGGGNGVLTYRGRDYPSKCPVSAWVLQPDHPSVGWKDGLQA